MKRLMLAITCFGASCSLGAQSPAPGAVVAATSAPPPMAAASSANPETGQVVVPAGSKVLLALKAPVDTKTAQPGDPVYLTSTFPVIVKDRVVIPAGMDVQGVIDSVVRPGRVAGRAKVTMHFTTLIFPNGSVIEIPASVNAVPGADGSKVHGKENTVEQSGTVGQDMRNIQTSTAMGAGIGGLATINSGSTGSGLGYGALAGSVGGVAYTLLTRGKEVVLPPGQAVEMALQRPLILNDREVYVPPTTPGPQFVPSPNQPKPLPKPQPPSMD